jgi:Na+/H+ antiporter NhaD/arsenite permease-like protein
MEHAALSFFSLISLLVLVVVYSFLITEKLNKVIVAGLGSVFLIFMQVFRTATNTSQEGAVQFISRNLDVLGFVIGMMILVGIVRESGAFEAIAIWLVKKVKGRPIPLLIVMSYLALVMTMLLSNIPTVLILTPIILVLVKEQKETENKALSTL